jgi:hypothetical protein
MKAREYALDERMWAIYAWIIPGEIWRAVDSNCCETLKGSVA